jgi:hypothetical protein
VLTAVLIAASASCAVPVAEVNAQLALDYASFDARSKPYGWRSLSASDCTDAAVALLTRYADENAARLSGDARRELAFHAGQALAFAGRDAESIAYFERAQDAAAPDEWREYVAATIAFLRRDAGALAAARAAYAAIAPSAMRLRFIDGFIACPDASYAIAAHCRM